MTKSELVNVMEHNFLPPSIPREVPEVISRQATVPRIDHSSHTPDILSRRFRAHILVVPVSMRGPPARPFISQRQRGEKKRQSSSSMKIASRQRHRRESGR